MAFDYVNAVPMTKALSTLIAGVEDAKVTDALGKQALPAIRMLILTATDGTGNHVLYTTLTDIGDSSLATDMESAVDAIMEESTVKDAIRAIATKLAAAVLILDQFGVMESQQKVAAAFEKTARADLDRLVKSPLLRSAAAAVAKRAADPSNMRLMQMFVSLDYDPDSQDLDTMGLTAYTGAQLPYEGAPDAGRLGVIVNGQAVEVTVAEGDTPIVALKKLLDAYELLPSNSKPPVSLAINERVNLTGTFTLPYIDPLSSAEVTGGFGLKTEGGSLTLYPRLYDATNDMMVATFYMTSRDPDATSTFIPGILGFRYGVSANVANNGTKGPHALAADLSQGKTTQLGGGDEATSTSAVSDSFFFKIDDEGGVTLADGNLVYQVNGLPERTVAVPAGTSPLGIASLLAQNLATNASDQRVLGAVRPSARITTSGTPLALPSLELVAFGVETLLAQVVVTIKSVPASASFAVVAPSSLTNALFDSAAKSIVVKTTLNRPKATTTTAGDEDGTEHFGDTLVVTHTQSAELQAVLKNFSKKR